MDPFTLPGLTSDALLLLFTVAGIALSGVKPYIELVPFARVGKPLHDPTLHTLNFLFNLGLVSAWAATTGHLAWHYALAIGVQAAAQWLGSTGGYHLVTRLGGSIGDSGPSSSGGAAAGGGPGTAALQQQLTDALAKANAALKASGS